MSWEVSEQSVVQEPAAARLAALGWTSVFAFDAETFGPAGTLGRADKSETVLWRSVREALRRLNPWISPEQVEEAVARLGEYEGAKSLLERNRAAYALVRDGVPVRDADRAEDAPDATRRARIVDFDRSENNEFLAVRELWISARGALKRPDLIGFVNGLPLVFMEFKKPTHRAKEGYDRNYRDYLATIPELFRFNAFLVFSAGNETKAGALGADWEFFGEWKRLAEDGDAETSLPRLLDGMCAPSALLDIVENFILFDKGDGTPTKILARYHQFLGVNRAYANYLRRRELGGKLGVFWHTQGSGKSYSMVFLARKILRKAAGSPTFLVVTDREELNDQIAGTFEACGCLGGVEAKALMPASGEDLAKRLETNPAFLFTLVQKFNSPTRPPLRTGHEIVIFSDEAHRTQNGILADNMLRFLPEASRLGFTGTPLQKGELTERQFGRYVSVYDFNRAVEDHATVPLYYRTKVDKLGLEAPGLNEELIEAIEQEDLAPEDRRRVEDAIRSKVMLYMAPERIRVVARDFVRDYSARRESGKAMVVSVNKVAAWRTWKAVGEEWARYADELEAMLRDPRKSARMTPEKRDDLEKRVAWMRSTRMELVISRQQGDKEQFAKYGIDIEPYWRRMRAQEPEKDFKKADSDFRVAFVCAMWLTGFDVKSLGTLYLDKPLKAHMLMQAIARANRVFEGKRNGVIVDYVGLIDYLGKALADFTGGAGGGGKPLPGADELLANWREALDAGEGLLRDNGFALRDLLRAAPEDRPMRLREAADAVAEPDNLARAFLAVDRRIADVGKFLDAADLSDADRARRSALHEIASHLRHHRAREKGDIGDLLAYLQKTIGEHVADAAGRVASKLEDVQLDLSKVDYSRLARSLREYRFKKLLLRQLSESAEQVVADMLAQNPACADYRRELQRIVDEYNEAHEKGAIEKALQEILKLLESLAGESERHVREGFDDPQQLAVFELLKSGKTLKPAELEEVRAIARTMLPKLRALVADVGDWREKAVAKAQVKVEIRNVLYEMLPGPLRSDAEQADCAEKVYQYFYQLPDVA